MDGLVSIITPTYNSEAFIEETVASIQAQTYTNWELFIIDDGSQDNSVAIIKILAEKDTRIKLIESPTNAGAAKARNRGIEAAQGQYMAFLDADDLWLPDFISSSIEAMKQSGCKFVFSSYHRVNEQLESVYSDFIAPPKVTYTDILKTNSIGCLTAFLDVKALGKKKMPEIKKRQDMGLWLKYLKEIPFAYGIQEPKAIYRIRENSLSRDRKALIKYQWELYRNVEKLSVVSSVYYMFHWMYNGFKKHSN